MTTAVVFIDSNDIRQIRHRTVNPSRFILLAQRLRRVARVVEECWNDIPDEDRELLKSLAYDLIEPPKGAAGLWFKIWAEAYMAYIQLTGQEELLNECLKALDCLIDNILDAIEREQTYYQQVLSDTLEELSFNPGAGEPVDVQGREWLQQISDKALKEV